MKKKYSFSRIAVLIVVMIIAAKSNAQLKGDHLLGDFGLSAGTQAPPSIIAALPVYSYSASKLIKDNGEAISTPSLNAFLLGAGFSAVTNFKILGGRYGASVLFAFMSNRIEGDSIQSKTPLAFSDMYVQPFQLGWNTKHADFTIGYGIYMPTGKYTYGGKDNAGLGMWTHEFSAGTTLYFNPKKTFHFSSIVFYETHSTKKDTTTKVGDMISIEGGLGKTFYHKVSGTPVPMVFNLGLIYYMQFKATDDKIPFGSTVFTGKRDHTYALGLEGNVLFPKSFTSLSFRWLGETGARNRFQGNTFLLTVGQLIKSFEKKKE